MTAARNNIFALFILFSSIFTLSGHDFFHHHENEKENTCYACLISSSLVTDSANSEGKVLSDPLPEFAIGNIKLIILSEPHFTAISDRAPPSA